MTTAPPPEPPPPPPPELEHLRWPPERFYWAILDASVLSPSGAKGWIRSSQRLGYLFESALPGIAIEEIHAVYRPLPGGPRYLACGLPRTVLERDVPPEAVTLTPTSLPSFVGEEIDPNDSNLLTGSFLPKAVRRLHRRWLVAASVSLMACAALIVVGLERRVHAAEAEAVNIAQASTRLFERALGPAGTRSDGSGQPLALRLTAELRRLEQTRNSDVPELVDCSAVLGDVLAHWPNDVRVQTESASITPTSITIRAGVPTMADAQRLADAFHALPGWRLHQPRSEARRDHVDVTLQFEPDQPEALP